MATPISRKIFTGGKTLTQHGINLTWQEATQGTTFNVFRGTTAGGEDFANPIVTGLTVMTFLDQNGVPGTTYFYVVEAVENGISSGPSNEATAVFPTIPAAPSSLSAIAV